MSKPVDQAPMLDTQQMVTLLSGAIQELENQFFLEKIQEQFWQIQNLVSTKFTQPLAMSQMKIQMLSKQIPFYKDKLKEIQDGTFQYETWPDSAGR